MSLIGKALATRPRNFIPSGSTQGFYSLPSLGMNASGDEAYMRAYGTVGTVWQIVHLLTSSVAKPEWRLYRKPRVDGRVRYTTNDQGSDMRQEVVNHQALAVLTRPNPFFSRFGLFEATGQHLELTGKGYWIVDRDPRATVPLGLWPVRPDRMTPVPDKAAWLKGWVYTAPDGIEQVPLGVNDVIFVRYADPLDPYGGAGPAQSVLVEADAARYAGEYNRNFFVNGARPDGVLQVDHSLRDEEWDSLSERWREAHRGVSRAHRIALLENGVTYQPVGTSPKDMDFFNLRNLSRDLIREAWGIHKIMLGNSDDVNRANAQTGEEVFANWSVVPRLDRWRDALNAQFLPLFYPPGADVPVEFDYIYPLPQNREQDNAELMAKGQVALWLNQAGYDPHDVLTVVGLPDMNPVTAPAGAPPGDDTETGADTNLGTGDTDLGNRLRLAPFDPRAVSRRPANAKDAAAKVYEQLAADYPPKAMAWMHHAMWKGPAVVPLDHIEPDMDAMDNASPEHVQDFVKLLKAGKRLKPVVLVKTPDDPQLKLVDGHHRYLASAEMEEPPRGFIGIVDSDHGDWEDMHDYQFPQSRSGAGSSSAQALGRRMAAWNALRVLEGAAR